MTTSTTALRLSKATVAQYLSSNDKLRPELSTPGNPVVLLLRGEPVWESDAVLSLGDGRSARVAAATSPLAVHELILQHALELDPEPRVLVILTDVEEHDLDPAILARTFRGQVHIADRWNIVRESFGAKQTDERLRREAWACEALLDAAGARRWPVHLGGAILTREGALTALAVRRLHLADGTERIDPVALLEWSQRPEAAHQFLSLRPAERAGLIAFLSEPDQAGATGTVLTALTLTEHGPDALAYGLLCGALWEHAQPGNAVYQARGRVERWLGDKPPAHGEALDRLLANFGRICEDYVRGLLIRARSAVDEHDDADSDALIARKKANTVLAHAESLVRQFGAGEAAACSPLLPTGLESRFTAVGVALALDDKAGAEDKIESAVVALRAHALIHDEPVRHKRVRMAQRLSRWLRTAPDPTVDGSVGDAIARQMRSTAWADRALDYLEAGGDNDPALRTAFAALAIRARKTRREFDREFAKNLVNWTQSGSAPGSLLTVESFLERVVAPVAATHRVMLLVIDGMSAAIATELASELASTFSEYDPVAPVAGASPVRRAMVAALPSLTAVSRTSLFAGKLVKGDQKTEKKVFGAHPFWGAKRAKVFHKNDLRGDAGQRFGPDLTDALADADCHVAVVLNTIDDRLAKEAKFDDSGWEVREIGNLRALTDIAAANGMAVIITSDHGHIIDRHCSTVTADGVQSARHRLPGGAGDRRVENEVLLAGPRVVWPEPGASIVALWDNDSRYTALKAGYHGGASLAEMTIPILALVPHGATVPTDWLGINEPRPRWWSGDNDVLEVAKVIPAPAVAAPKKSKKAPAPVEDQITFDIPLVEVFAEPDPAEAPKSGVDLLIAALLDSDTFAAQLETVARKPKPEELDKALRALLDGPLPLTALAQRVGRLPTRAAGFGAILGQLLNVDGVQVLETLADGRTVRLHVALLREQFGLR
ncbi:BREX-2 system phosphatase PglZ [Nocardia camponoti]|uniref:BREX-2 system phosphatase PglZ n=1 Tax=Nocardia camponoti TaxID=1616106 RepID=A0A917QTW9_9NOCA|nr:BREX-2 system phosphatase PglZ [Nocardia camponoti]GGK66926.1 hypothetical protein GCM10011591_43840 [Nocardia camponoti]